ncbi:7315_t:CDS:10 [Paraglomus occultum]|uniref:7315_t:CDS:1 n=1 Tax=Paraglomus occultum TaxID=144539 RepID=A0A9N9BWQ9_9GLOM|nr:7315_t:CDS:10 [Paraglomus occultum]
MASKDAKDTITAEEFLEQQRKLEKEAAEVLPWNFDHCTYSRGYLRQPVYACKTCKPKPGYGPDHVLVELFNKRSFRCDCGTARLGEKPCELEPKERDVVNTLNQYNHNYEGRFCWCDVEYDPEKEESNMYQDWYHENCMNGGKQGDQEFTLPECELFEEYVCRSCTERYPFLKLYCDSHLCFARMSKKVSLKSTLGDRSIDSKADSILSDESRIRTDSDNNRSQSAESSKRKVVDDQKFTPLKKTKSLSGPACRLEKFASINVDENYFDLFCVSGWRDDLCRCAKCKELYKRHKLEFLLEEEETYEPPKDEDKDSSLFENGVKLLTQMDRVTAIEGLIAYNKMRDEIREFLKTFADSGRTVTEHDIRAFFESKLADHKSSRNNTSF